MDLLEWIDPSENTEQMHTSDGITHLNTTLVVKRNVLNSTERYVACGIEIGYNERRIRSQPVQQRTTELAGITKNTLP